MWFQFWPQKGYLETIIDNILSFILYNFFVQTLQCIETLIFYFLWPWKHKKKKLKSRILSITYCRKIWVLPKTARSVQKQKGTRLISSFMALGIDIFATTEEFSKIIHLKNEFIYRWNCDFSSIALCFMIHSLGVIQQLREPNFT